MKPKPNIKKSLEELKALNEQIELVNKSILFWEKRIENIFDEIDEVEEESWRPDFEERVASLMQKMEALLKRMCTEEQIIEKLDKKILKVHERIFAPYFKNE
jgi:predicted  nucleic acid-binding Zn-ribbon protein